MTFWAAQIELPAPVFVDLRGGVQERVPWSGLDDVVRGSAIGNCVEVYRLCASLLERDSD